MGWQGRWAGGAAVCLASGPSLTQADVDLAIAWRDAGANRYVLVCNTTFKNSPTADVLYAHDHKWWKTYIKEINESFKGVKVTNASTLPNWNVERIAVGKFKPFGNSGAAIVSLSIYAGCKEVYLLGYDCCRGPRGEVHHHGNHPRGMGNALSLPGWPKKFEKLSKYAIDESVRVVNCSRRTVLECFPRQSLEDVLESSE